MLRHRLASLFEPRSVLVISTRELAVARNPPKILHGRVSTATIDAAGEVHVPAVVAGLSSDERLDLALLCVKPDDLPRVFEAMRALRPRAVIVLTHEISSLNPAETRTFCQAWGMMNDCLVLGPGAFGLQRPHLGINLSLNPETAPAGRVALVAQSRMIASTVMDWAGDINLGFSAVISVGDEKVVDVAEILDYLSMDSRTDSVVLYLEEAASSRRFTSALNAVASIKPVIVLKVGREAEAGDAVFDALLRRTGAVRIRFFVQLFSALKVLAHTHHHPGRRIAIFSNGYGAAHLALDVIGSDAPVSCSELAAPTRKALAELLEPGASLGNPVISHAPLNVERVSAVLSTLVADKGIDGVLVLIAPDVLSDMEGVAHLLADMSRRAHKPIISCFMGDAGGRPLRHLLDDVGLPAFRTPESAVNAFGILANYQHNQTLAQQTLPPVALARPPRWRDARAVLEHAYAAQRLELDQADCARLLDCFHVPIQIIDRAEDVAPCDAISVPMSLRVRQDHRFGPYMQFSAGGEFALLDDPYREIGMPPLNRYLARQLIQRSQLWHRVLSHEMSPAAFDLLRESLERISEMVSELPSIASLVLDPVWADDTRLTAASVAIRLSEKYDPEPPENRAYRHMAIHPYPRRLVQSMTFGDGQEWLLRPIRPEDATLLQEFVRNLSDESRYMRFISMLRELTPRMLARYTRIDYDRELALLATIQVPNPENRGLLRERIIGFAHYLRNADGMGAEYALVIADDWQRRGLGAQLMRSLIRAARRQGLAYIDGVVLAGNRPMLGLMTHLGFRNDRDESDPGMRRVWLDLSHIDGDSEAL